LKEVDVMSIQRFNSAAPIINTNLSRIALELTGTTENGGLIAEISRYLADIDDKYRLAYERFTHTLEEASQLDAFRSTLISMLFDVLPIPGLGTAIVTATRMEGHIADATSSLADSAFGQTNYTSVILRRIQPGAPSGPGPVDGSFSSSMREQILDLHRFATRLLRLKLRVEQLSSIANGVQGAHARGGASLRPDASRYIDLFLAGWPGLLNGLEQTLVQVRSVRNRLEVTHRTWAGRTGASVLESYLWIVWIASLSDHSVLGGSIFDSLIADRLEGLRLIGNPSVFGVDFGSWISTEDTYLAHQRARGLRRNVENAFRDYIVPAFSMVHPPAPNPPQSRPSAGPSGLIY
jgi:hypothetical protein